MQGMPGMDEEESNLAALGMHVTGGAKDEEDEDEEVKVKDEVPDEEKTEEEADEEKKEEEEVDALAELDQLAAKLKEEESPTMVDDEE